ncbi:MAG: flagellar basal body protein FliL [Spirochaetaceae bacterium]|jgi:flagellar basal body-associated protein FliL|nr:flagellar basal body protein FliL [Spirochaetaceae bacterium]
MIRVVEHSAQGLRVLYRVLVGVILLLIFILLMGTLYALVIRGPAGLKPGEDHREEPAGSGDYTDNIFTGIGRIRALTAGPLAATVILSVAFPYAPEDRAFSEELAAKIGQFRGITAEYFASFSAGELREKEEGVIKEELRQRYNAILRLGNITQLYFNDYMIIE